MGPYIANLKYKIMVYCKIICACPYTHSTPWVKNRKSDVVNILKEWDKIKQGVEWMFENHGCYKYPIHRLFSKNIYDKSKSTLNHEDTIYTSIKGNYCNTFGLSLRILLYGIVAN
jgi:hypothetical protein